MIIKALQNLGTYAVKKQAFRYGYMGPLIVAAADFLPRDVGGHMKLLKSGWKGLKAIRKAFGQIAHDIDSRVDAMPAHELLAAGESRLGPEPSPFISNPKIITGENWSNFHLLSSSGLMKAGEVNAFCNLMGHYVRAEAVAMKNYADTGAPVARKDMARAHLALDAVVLGMAAHVMRGEGKISEAAAQKPLDLDAVGRVYPAATTMGYLLQVQDDGSDLLYDLARERATGRPSPNLVLAIADNRKPLYGGNGVLVPEIADFIDSAMSSNARVPLDALPRQLRDGFDIANEFHDKCVRKLSPVVQPLLTGYWKARVRGGFSARLDSAKAKTEARYQALTG